MAIEVDNLNHSFYLISNDYVPILMNKTLLKNPKLAVTTVDDILLPKYFLDNFKKKYAKKTPNAFIIFRSEMFKKVSINNPKKSSREISTIIGKLWNKMSKESKLPYNHKSKAIDNKINNGKIVYKYKKFLNNVKQRNYTKTKKLSENNILSIQKLLFLQ